MERNLKIVTYITSLFFAIVLIASAVKFTVNFRPLYYFDVDYLNLPQVANVSKKEIIKNYDILIDYLKTSYKGDLKFTETFPMSGSGETHFKDVKNLFINIDILMYVSIVITLIGGYYLIKNKHYIFFRLTSIFLFLLPILLILPMAINFDAAFTVFHKIFFRNNDWIFDPDYDPIINVLPENFFMHCALLILLIIIVEGIILNLLYKYLLKRYIKELPE